MKKTAQYAVIYGFGSLGYSAIEVLWRGYTHWTMALTGGACFLSIYLVNLRLRQLCLMLRCLIGSAVITGLEFSVGCLVNLRLGWRVWDYSNLKPNLLGQICLLYSMLWFLLCFPCNHLCKIFREKIFRTVAE